VKYEIDNFSKSATIDNYEVNGEELVVTYLDGSTTKYPSYHKWNFDNMMHKQAKLYVNNRDRGADLLKMAVPLSLSMLFGLVSTQYSAITMLDIYLAFNGNINVLPTIFHALTTYFGVKATFLFGAVYKEFYDENKDKKKYELFLKNKDLIRQYQYTSVIEEGHTSKKRNKVIERRNATLKAEDNFTGDINTLDQMELKRLKKLLTEIKQYNKEMGIDDKNNIGFSRVKR